MDKPCALHLRAYKVSRPESIKVHTKFLSEDRWETKLVLKQGDRELRISDDTFNDLYDISTLYNGVAVLKSGVVEEVSKWHDFLEKNKQDYEQYQNLKEKFKDC